MSTSNSNSKIVLYGGLGLLVICLFLSARYYALNNENESRLNSEKLKSESLLSEKLQLQKEIDSYKKQIQHMQGQNAELDKSLADTKKLLAEKEAKLRQIDLDDKSAKNLSRQVAELKNIRSGLESQIASLNQEITKLKDENSTLRKENENATAMIAHLEKENKSMSDNLRLMSALTADNLVLVTKKNDKLTVKSRQAKKIDFIFDVPQKSMGALEFKIISPDSKVFSKADGSITYHVVPGDGNPVAALGSNGNFELVEKVEMQFRPKEQLKKGIYKIEVYNETTKVGSMQVKLR